jgi:TetR/AcrR family hemagglutinin/protease transcriptional regulator
MKRPRQGAQEQRPVREARLPSNQRYTQLLACALKIFAEHGIGAANHALVATEAKVSVATVFFYFNTREKLVDAVLSEVEHFVGSAFETAIHDDRAADEVLLQLIGSLMQALATHPYHVRVFLEWSIAMRAEIWPRYLKLGRRLLFVLTKLIERGQQEGGFRPDMIPEDEAQILHAASFVLIQMKLADAPNSRIERFQNSMFQMLILPPIAKRVSLGQTRSAAERKRRASLRKRA